MNASTLRTSLHPSVLLAVFDGARLVRRDADEIMRVCGVSAFEAAELNSLHEDLGLMRTPRPGHWSRVAREIARRTNQHRDEPAFRQAA